MRRSRRRGRRGAASEDGRIGPAERGETDRQAEHADLADPVDPGDAVAQAQHPRGSTVRPEQREASQASPQAVKIVHVHHYHDSHSYDGGGLCAQRTCTAVAPLRVRRWSDIPCTESTYVSSAYAVPCELYAYEPRVYNPCHPPVCAAPALSHAAYYDARVEHYRASAYAQCAPFPCL